MESSLSATGGRGLRLDRDRVVVVVPVERARDAPAVDEDGRCRLDAERAAGSDVLAHAIQRFGSIEAGPEAPHVEAELAREAEQVLARQAGLILEQQVVVLPELALLRRALRRARREARHG